MPKTKCKQVPKKKCKDVPVFVPRKECKDFPKTVCLKDPIQVKKSLPKKVCFSVPEQARSHNRLYSLYPRAKVAIGQQCPILRLPTWLTRNLVPEPEIIIFFLNCGK